MTDRKRLAEQAGKTPNWFTVDELQNSHAVHPRDGYFIAANPPEVILAYEAIREAAVSVESGEEGIGILSDPLEAFDRLDSDA